MLPCDKLSQPGVQLHGLKPAVNASLPINIARTRHNSIRGNGEVIKREEFEQRQAAAEAAARARLDRRPKKLASAGKDLEGCPLLQVGVWYRAACNCVCVQLCVGGWGRLDRRPNKLASAGKDLEGYPLLQVCLS